MSDTIASCADIRSTLKEIFPDETREKKSFEPVQHGNSRVEIHRNIPKDCHLKHRLLSLMTDDRQSIRV